MTGTEQPSLAEFLLERIADDEEDITTAPLYEPKPFDGDDLGGYWDVEERHGFRYLGIRRARALAECEAKRRILALHDSKGSHECTAGQAAGAGEDIYVTSDECPTLHALSLPYTRHPDYRQEWAL